MSNFQESATREEAIAVNTDLRNFTQAVLGDPEKESNLAAYRERVKQVRPCYHRSFRTNLTWIFRFV